MNRSEKESQPANLSEKKLFDLARKRLERFASLLPKTLVGDRPDNVHDLRVWSRRLQQIFKVLLADRPNGKSRKLIRVPRRARRALGECRNLDVCNELVQHKLEASSSDLVRSAWRRFQAELRARREAELERGRSELRRQDIVKYVTDAQACLEELKLGKSFAQELTISVEEARVRWHEAFAEALKNQTADQLHALRIAGKRLRYRAELMADLGHAPARSLVKALKVLQDNLGSWHDAQVLLRLMAEFIGHADFLAEHPDLARILLTEMEKERQRHEAAVGELLQSAEKVRAWNFADTDAVAEVIH